MVKKTHRTIMMLLGLGVAEGVVGGLLGIGGGALVVPALVFLVKLDQHRAHGTSLLAALLLAASGAVTYSVQGNVKWIPALEIAAGGVCGAMLGARAAGAVKARALRRVFSLFIVVVGIRMILGACGVEVESHRASDLALTNGVFVGALVAVGVGVLTGFVSALLGVGGGMIMVPALVILLCTRQQLAQGISLAAMLPTVFTGMLMHRGMGNVDFRVGGLVGTGAILGAFLGGTAAAGLSTSTLQLAFGAFLLIMAALMALKK